MRRAGCLFAGARSYLLDEPGDTPERQLLDVTLALLFVVLCGQDTMVYVTGAQK